MKRITSVIMILWASVLIGCSDFLEPKSQSEFVPKTAQDLNEMLLGEVYMGPEDGGMYGALGILDDDVTTRPVAYEVELQSKVDQLKFAYTWSDDRYVYATNYNIYETVYQQIVGCNAVLDFIDGVSGAKEQKDYVRAQALAMRGFYYFYLVNLYGKPYSFDKTAPGVPLKLRSKLENSTPARNRVEEVYGQIVSDFCEAEELYLSLSESLQWKSDGRASLPMVQLMLSRVYLYMEDWKQAMAYGEKVMKHTKFSMLNLSTIDPFLENVTGYPVYYKYSNPEVIFLFGAESDVLSLPYSSYLYKMQPSGFNAFAFFNVASRELVEAFDDRDLRKERYLMRCQQRTGEVGTFYCPFGKYESSANYGMSIGVGEQWGGALKITEAYLNAAEAAAALYMKGEGDTYKTKALDWMNQLRYYRFSGEDYKKVEEVSEVSNGTLLDFVREERRRELCFENHRWFDLRRYGMEPLTHEWYNSADEVVEYSLEKNDPGFTLLIPKEAMEMNSALVQNDKRGK